MGLYEQLTGENRRVIDNYLDSRESSATASAYHSDLTQFFVYCQGKEIDPVKCHYARAVNTVKDFLAGLGLSPASINRKRSVIVNFMESKRPEMFKEYVKPVARLEKSSGFLDPATVQDLLSYKEIPARAALAIALIFYGNLKISGLLDEELSPVQCPEVEEFYKEYLKERPTPSGHYRQIFLNYAGRPMSRQLFWREISDLGAKYRVANLTPASIYAAGLVRLHIGGMTNAEIAKRVGIDEFTVARNVRTWKQGRAGSNYEVG